MQLLNEQPIPPGPQQQSVLPDPLGYREKRTLMQYFLYGGTATLASGTVTIVNPRFKTTSIPMVCYQSAVPANTLKAAMVYNATTFQVDMVITSSSGTDASVVNYHVLLI